MAISPAWTNIQQSSKLSAAVLCHLGPGGGQCGGVPGLAGVQPEVALHRPAVVPALLPLPALLPGLQSSLVQLQYLVQQSV